MHMYIYMYVCMCVCESVCVCVRVCVSVCKKEAVFLFEKLKAYDHLDETACLNLILPL